MAYDMTFGNGGGFGGGSGGLGFLGEVGRNWHNGWSNGMRFATDLYNFQDENAVRPSRVNAQIGANNVAQQQNQAAYQDYYDHNEAYSLVRRLGNTTPNQMYGQVSNNQANQYMQGNVDRNALPPYMTGTTPYDAAYGVTRDQWLRMTPAAQQQLYANLYGQYLRPVMNY